MPENNKSINMLKNPNEFFKNTKATSDVIKEEQKKKYLSMLTRTEGEGLYPFQRGIASLKDEEESK